MSNHLQAGDPWRPFHSDCKPDGVALRETQAALPHTEETAQALASTLARTGSRLDRHAEMLKTRLSSLQATSKDVRRLAATLEAQQGDGPPRLLSRRGRINTPQVLQAPPSLQKATVATASSLGLCDLEARAIEEAQMTLARRAIRAQKK